MMSVSHRDESKHVVREMVFYTYDATVLPRRVKREGMWITGLIRERVESRESIKEEGGGIGLSMLEAVCVLVILIGDRTSKTMAEELVERI